VTDEIDSVRYMDLRYRDQIVLKRRS